ncbi:Nucleic acid-binding, OB-fold [Sesbania bispinosa]|nr:Nucleic acid-binding, OB-fold [Sesbania bispinosa]
MASVVKPYDPFATQMLLVDEEGDIRLAVFGEMIDVVAGFLSLPRIGLPVLIVHLAKVNLYKGEVGIQNVMNATKFFWNPDLPEAIDFKNGLAVHEIETELDIGKICQRNRPVSLKEEFLQLYPKKTLRQLVEATEVGWDHGIFLHIILLYLSIH